LINMVRVLKKRRSLYVWRNIHLNKSRIIIFFTLLVLAFMLFIMNRFPYASVGLILVPLSYGLGIYAYKNYLIWLEGSKGEGEVNSVLEELDDGYILISDIVVPPNRGDTDHIIVGPNGIFVIETKNYGGEITCNGDVWSRRKIGRGGGVYRLEIGRPSNQVKRNAKVLKDFILEHQGEVFQDAAPHIWVHSILVFTNKDAVLKINEPTVSIMSVDELVGCITSIKSESTFTTEEVDAIGTVILKYSRL
jgi:hypothetical protein